MFQLIQGRSFNLAHTGPAMQRLGDLLVYLIGRNPLNRNILISGLNTTWLT
jgi:hypothetical protein